MRFRFNLCCCIAFASIALLGCGSRDEFSPEDITLPEKPPSPVQTVTVQNGGPPPPAVVTGTLVEFRGSHEMSDDEREHGRKFYLRIVRIKPDGTRVTHKSANADAVESGPDGQMSFQHVFEVPKWPGQYEFEVKIGKRVVNTAELTVRADRHQ
jgi:hypothetical protein